MLGDRRGYSHLKEEALNHIKWRNRFGGGCGPVVWQITYDDCYQHLGHPKYVLLLIRSLKNSFVCVGAPVHAICLIHSIHIDLITLIIM
jgi:hypothetical protein